MASRGEAKGGTLIVGGGFAGAYVARLLRKRGATIVSPDNFMLFTPLLPEAASGTIEPRHAVVPLRLMCPHAELLLGHATELDTERRFVRVVPPTSQHALRQARRLAKNLQGPPRPYRYRSLGQVATLGRYKGIADVMGLPVRGFLGSFVTRTYNLYQLPLLSRKLRVVTDWTVSLFFRRDIAELGLLGHPRGLADD
jgi:NADH dehydrogenase FAD-containing subunit